MDKLDQGPDDLWQDEWMNALYQVASLLRELEKANPWPERPLLPQALEYLMTELWDRGFSQTEIRVAYNDAIARLPGYAADEEVNG